MRILYINENRQLYDIPEKDGKFIFKERNFIIGAIIKNRFFHLDSEIEDLFTNKEILAIIDRFDINLVENLDFSEDGRTIQISDIKVCELQNYISCVIPPNSSIEPVNARSIKVILQKDGIDRPYGISYLKLLSNLPGFEGVELNTYFSQDYLLEEDDQNVTFFFDSNALVNGGNPVENDLEMYFEFESMDGKVWGSETFTLTADNQNIVVTLRQPG